MSPLFLYSDALEIGLFPSWNSVCVLLTALLSVFIFHKVPCRLFFMVKDIFIYIKKGNILLLDINMKCWAFCSWMRDRFTGWTTFLVLWSGRMPCFELRFFLIWSRREALVSLAEPAVAEAAGCYDHDIFLWASDSLHLPHCSRKQSHANLASLCCAAAFFLFHAFFFSEGC